MRETSARIVSFPSSGLEASDASLLEELIPGLPGDELIAAAGGTVGGILELSDLKLRALGLNASQLERLRTLKLVAARFAQPAPSARLLLDQPAVIVGWLRMQYPSPRQEQLGIVYLCVRNRLRGSQILYRGTSTNCPYKPAEIIRSVLEAEANRYILSHNHPSSDPAPSLSALLMTRRMAKASSLLDLDFLDHIILGGDRYVSLRRKRREFFTKS